MKPLIGVIHGNRIDLAGDSGLPDGQKVEILVCPARPEIASGAGLQRCAGAMAAIWTEDDDRILDEIQRDRGGPSLRASY